MSDATLKILLVEDNPGDARLIREMLLELPRIRFEVELADRLATGLARMRTGNIHAILLDLGLPDSWGHDTFLAAHATASHIPIIVLTGVGDEALAIRTVQEGAQDYLVKGQADASVLERSIRYAVERKKAEQTIRSSEMALQRSQKMESVGRLAGGMAHDFNNLLGVILGYSEVLEDRLDDNEELRKHAGQIKKAALSAAGLTRQLLAFSRQQVLEPTVLNLNSVVADIGTMLRPLIGEDIELTTVLEPALGQVKADRGQIEQVIMNLAVNARDAMPHGGRLRIRTASVEVDENSAQLYPSQSSGSYVLLEVSDTGTGMDAETQVHIFEPFFTTKDVGRGTGLGLSTVYGVIKQSGGFIWVYSELGQGTTFEIHLPRTAEETRAAKPTLSPARSLHGTETILLVEDAESLRELTRNLLAESGYTVLEAKGPEDAIQIARQSSHPIHLLLTDVIMPGMKGPELAGNLTSLKPGMRVLYMSGYSGFAHRGLINSDAMILAKPFSREALLNKVHEVLTRKSQKSGAGSENSVPSSVRPV
jgi:two-component system, cell cycle sensor histidine kinase and response regulator CckA